MRTCNINLCLYFHTPGDFEFQIRHLPACVPLKGWLQIKKFMYLYEVKPINIAYSTHGQFQAHFIHIVDIVLRNPISSRERGLNYK